MNGSLSLKASRIRSIDLIRGAVMILMAIDHVRVFAGVPPGGTTADLFFTRWITHFCAPAFVFLAGTSAFFYGRKHADLSRFLLTRGVWLILLELTFLRFAWTFNFDFANYEMAGVIWVIGWSMVIMAGLVKLPIPALASFGLLMMVGHNLVDPVMWDLVSSLGNDAGSALWKVAYVGFFAGPITVADDGPNLIVLYSLIPWVGVMAAGFAFGKIMTLEAPLRNRWCLGLGLGAVALFVALRGLNLYGDPQPWTSQSDNGMPALLSFLNTTKYPASFSFLLMTLGPAIALMPSLDRGRGAIAERVELFGRVPFFYYMLHIPLIHVLALGVSYAMHGEVSPWLFANHPMGSPPPPDGYAWDLWLLYAVWAVTIVVLYYACRWWAELKSRRKDWWLQYL